MDKLFSETIQNWAIISSFVGLLFSTIGLGISIFVLRDTSVLRKHYLKKSTIQDVNDNVRDQLKKLDRVMKQKPIVLKDANKIKSLILGSLKQAKKRLNQDEQRQVDNLISKFDSTLLNETECHEFHFNFLEISSYMSQTQKESNWS